MIVGPLFERCDFRLEEHELLGGEPVFLLPTNQDGEFCELDGAFNIEAYTYNHLQVDLRQIFPCSPSNWDRYAYCLSAGRLCLAQTALGTTANSLLLSPNPYGYFTRNAGSDMHWEKSAV